MTRLEKQLKEMENEWKLFTQFSEKKNAIFQNHFPFLESVLKEYGVTIVSTDNRMVDRSIIGEATLYLRIWVKVEGVENLSDRRKKNMETKLRQYFPMPMCPITKTSIDIYYSETI